MKCAYGTDKYWVDRYERPPDEEDRTDEWCLSWAHLEPLLRPHLPAAAAVADLGCGTSSLAFDLLRGAPDGVRVVAVDLAPAAICAQKAAQAARVREGERSAARAEFKCADVCRAGAWAGRFDACVDKATTDGLLCDTRRGAERVRSMYARVPLRPEAAVCVVSWRDPLAEGVDWLVDCVLRGLRDAEAEAAAGSWSLDVHSIVDADAEEEAAASGPHVYLLRRRPRRRSRRRLAVAQRAGAAGEEELVMRHHCHAVER